MKTRNPEAARLENDYLQRLDDSIKSWDRQDAEDVRQGVKEHIEEALSAFSDQEASLVQMAEVLERLGAPESYAQTSGSQQSKNDVSPPPRSDGPIDSGNDQKELDESKGDWVKFLDKLWVAQLIGVIGLYVPILDIYFCAFASTLMLLFAMKTKIVEKSPALSSLNGLIISILALICVSPITASLSLASPVFELLDVPVAIALLVIQLMLFWKIMGGLSELVALYKHSDLAKKIHSARQLYIALTLGLICFAFFIGLIIAVFSGGLSQDDNIVFEIVIALVSLPFSWLLGWYFYLRPITMAKNAMTE